MSAIEREDQMFDEWEEETWDVGFQIVDDGGAMWAAKKIREAEQELAFKLDWYNRQIEAAKARCEATKARMIGYLQDYSETVPMRETKTMKKYAFPGGELIWKKAHDEWRHDDEKVIAALKEQGRTEFIKTVEKLDWAAYKKEINDTGEVVDGITVETVPDTFTVKVSEGV